MEYNHQSIKKQTLPSLSTSVSSSCSSSLNSNSPISTTSPYYYYSNHSLHKQRPHSISIKPHHYKRISIQLPPQRSLSSGSNYIPNYQRQSMLLPNHQHHPSTTSTESSSPISINSSPINTINNNKKDNSKNEKWWDESQLDMDLAVDIDDTINHSFIDSNHNNNIKSKLRQWFHKKKKLFH